MLCELLLPPQHLECHSPHRCTLGAHSVLRWLSKRAELHLPPACVMLLELMPAAWHFLEVQAATDHCRCHCWQDTSNPLALVTPPPSHATPPILAHSCRKAPAAREPPLPQQHPPPAQHPHRQLSTLSRLITGLQHEGKKQGKHSEKQKAHDIKGQARVCQAHSRRCGRLLVLPQSPRFSPMLWTCPCPRPASCSCFPPFISPPRSLTSGTCSCSGGSTACPPAGRQSQEAKQQARLGREGQRRQPWFEQQTAGLGAEGDLMMR